MRRRSIVGPLLLVLVGLAFLVHNLLPDIPLGDLLARYWPFLLIAWGMLRLLEIVTWAAMRKPLGRSGMGGGEWVLVILICLVGSALYSGRKHMGWLPSGRSLRGMVVNMGETYDFNIDAVSKNAHNPRLILENFRGNARISGVDGDEVKASGRKTIRALQQSDADQANTQTPLELVSQGDDLIVRTNQDHVKDELRVSSDLEITVPKGASVEAHGRNGDFEIHDIAGSVDISSDNAGVRIDGIGGNVRIDLRKSDLVRATSVKGSVELKGRGQDVELQNIDGPVTIAGDYLGQIQMHALAQPLRFESAHTDLQIEKLPGELHMGLGEFTASNVLGPMRLVSRARDVNITDFTQSLEVNLDRGDIELSVAKGPVPKMDVHTKSGNIELSLPSPSKFDLRMATNRGEAHNEFGSPLAVEEEKHGATVLGLIGSGPQLRIDTGRGTVTIRKSSEDLKVEQQ